MDLQKLTECLNFINDFYVNEIIEKKYKITEITTRKVKVITETGKSFCFWIGNSQNNFYTYNDENFIHLNFTESEKTTLFNRFWKELDKRSKKPAAESLRKEIYEHLKNELNLLNEL